MEWTLTRRHDLSIGWWHGRLARANAFDSRRNALHGWLGEPPHQEDPLFC